MKKLIIMLVFMLMGIIYGTQSTLTNEFILGFDDPEDFPEYVSLGFDDPEDFPEYVSLGFDDPEDFPEYVSLNAGNGRGGAPDHARGAPDFARRNNDTITPMGFDDPEDFPEYVSK